MVVFDHVGFPVGDGMWSASRDFAICSGVSPLRNAKKIREKVFHILGDRSDSAEKICRKLKEQAFPFHLEELEEAFHFDDHTLWDICTGEKGKRTKEKWNKLLSYTAANRQDHRKRRGSQKGGPEGRGRNGKIRKVRLQKVSPSVFCAAGRGGAGYGKL